VARLIRIKAIDEHGVPLEGCSTSWIAVPGGDQAGIAEVLGLSGEQLATFSLGHSVVLHDSNDWPDPRRVYLTPEVEGWTLVVGPWCDPVDPERANEVLDAVTELSRRFGRAQAYYFGEHGGGSGWALAEKGGRGPPRRRVRPGQRADPRAGGAASRGVGAARRVDSGRRGCRMGGHHLVLGPGPRAPAGRDEPFRPGPADHGPRPGAVALTSRAAEQSVPETGRTASEGRPPDGSLAYGERRSRPWIVADELWSLIKLSLPVTAPKPGGGRPWAPDRQALCGMPFPERAGRASGTDRIRCR
jgi:hypothetical protein